MKRMTTTAALVCLALAPFAARASQISEARALPWTVSDEANLRRLLPDVGAVNRFIQAVLPKPTDDNPAPLTNEYAFADLRGDGKVELVCSLSDGGRFFSGIAVIAKTASGFVYAKADDGGALDIPALDHVLVSADGRPGLELLLPRWLGVYPGAAPGPIVFDIYAYADGRLKRADTQFSDYYRKVLLPDLEAKIERLRSAPTSGNAEIDARNAADIDAHLKGLRAMQAMLEAAPGPQ
jgi:hypothetical protein